MVFVSWGKIYNSLPVAVGEELAKMKKMVKNGAIKEAGWGVGIGGGVCNSINMNATHERTVSEENQRT